MNILRIAASLAMVEAKALVARISPFAGTRISRDEWDGQYSSGQWDRLRHVDELPHYSAIAGYVLHFVGVGNVLDVGCGEGILQEALGGRYSRYVGIDLAAAAIRKAAGKTDDATTFECADAMHYAPNDAFAAVVFNEVLYYFDAPRELLARYAACLGPDGVTIVSMAVTRRSLRIWNMLDEGRHAAAEVLVANRTAAWIVKAYRGGF